MERSEMRWKLSRSIAVLLSVMLILAIGGIEQNARAEGEAPAGYNRMSGEITFLIANGVVEAPTGGDVTYTPASAAADASFTIGNTPGV
ncbi:MAG: hypothetical protein IK099_06615 [Clostridia bacterium]|nr:hypothetical protein [Clostridia bacterium]